MAIFGLMVGLMIGRLTAPDPLELRTVEVLPAGLALWFNEEPQVQGEHIDGMLVLTFDADGKPARGTLMLDGKNVRWKVHKNNSGLVLNVLAARPLQGDWRGAKVDGRWRLEVSLREE